MASAATFAASAAETDTAQVVQSLGRGINLSNVFDTPEDESWPPALGPQYFHEIKDAGFNSIRLPVTLCDHQTKQPPFTIDPAFLDQVDWAINESLLLGLSVVLDLHNCIEMEKQPDAQLPKVASLWAQLATHYRNYSRQLYFELLNEPAGELTDDKWQSVMTALLHVVRETNPDRTVIIGPASWNSVDHLHNLILPAEDRHILVTFHYYIPFQFTHQGASWMAGSDDWLGTRWTDNADERSALEHDFSVAAAWAAQNQRPLYLGEFGAFERADMQSRASWTRAVVEAAEAREFGWAYWEFSAGFGAYDPQRSEWRQPLLRALIPVPQQPAP